MTKYVLAYFGGDMPESEEAGRAVMDAWTAWFAGMGTPPVDPGSPVGGSASISPDGTVGDAASGLSGYSIVDADSLEAAIEVARACPHLAANGRIEVFETVEAM